MWTEQLKSWQLLSRYNAIGMGKQEMYRGKMNKTTCERVNEWASIFTIRVLSVICAHVPWWRNVTIKQDCTGRTVLCSGVFLFLFSVPFLCCCCIVNRACSWNTVNEQPKWGCSDNEGIRQLRGKSCWDKAEKFLFPLAHIPHSFSLLSPWLFHILNCVIKHHAFSNGN